MTKKHRENLRTRDIQPFNVESKSQEKEVEVAANNVWDRIIEKYPDYEFNNLKTLDTNGKGLDDEYCVNYLNRGYKMEGLPTIDPESLQAHKSSSGIKPDGGVFFVKSEKDDFNHIIGAVEAKHQGRLDGYTPVSDTAWKKDKYRKHGPVDLERPKRPPQAQGNAIERFAKNANAIRTLTSFYGYNPYIIFCEGFDFYLKHEYSEFEDQPYAEKFKEKDSSILMRLIAGNDWHPLNQIYVKGKEHGKTKVCPATIMARMKKWKTQEIEDVLEEVIERSLEWLEEIDEI